MSAIDDLFARLHSERRKALMPFITAGDPDLAFSAELLRELAGTDPRTPVASAVIPHPRLTAEVTEQSLRPAG